MQEVRTLIEKAAPSLTTVLLRGESGTGKGLAARAIHDRSPRRNMPFVKIECAALPESLLESELFGYERGAFTGATARKPGRIELAAGGTLFFDEVGDVSPAVQVKLLRLVQEKRFERLGGTTTLGVDIRILAATHRDLEAMTKQGEFREDLYYRLAVLPVWLPPLRTRRHDVGVLAHAFCRALAGPNGQEVTLDEDAIRALRRERWPGNVRQLQNFVERLVVLSDASTITPGDVLRELTRTTTFVTESISSVVSEDASIGRKGLEVERRAAERRTILAALERARGNKTLAAQELGVSRRTLYYKLAECGIP